MTGQVRMESGGSPPRPLEHIEDISRAFLAVLEALRELVPDQAFNIGRAQDNVQVRDIAEMVRDAMAGSKITSAGLLDDMLRRQTNGRLPVPGTATALAESVQEAH
jgi:nucleoside-diphosphate-sugar epimerase